MKGLVATSAAVAFAVSVAHSAGAEEDATSTINAMSQAYQQSRVSMSNDGLEQRIRTFMFDYFANRSGTDARSLKALEGFYAEDVKHSGRQTRREIVMIDLRNSFTQWPQRSYNFSQEKLRVECFEPTGTVKLPTCEAGGVFDWTASNAAENVGGGALFDFQMIVRDNVPKIFLQSAILVRWKGGPASRTPLPLP
jgi:hypothetical protein